MFPRFGFQDSEEADLVWVTETWLTDDVDNCEILNNSYTIYRKDRITRQGGGVMLAVKASSFNSSREIEDFNGNIEVVSCEIITNSNHRRRKNVWKFRTRAATYCRSRTKFPDIFGPPMLKSEVRNLLLLQTSQCRFILVRRI